MFKNWARSTEFLASYDSQHSPSGKLDCYDLLEYVGERRYASENEDKKEMLFGKQERFLNIKKLRKEQIR